MQNEPTFSFQVLVLIHTFTVYTYPYSPWRKKSIHFLCPSSRFLGISGFWHFFQCDITLLLGAPKWNLNWIDLLCPDILFKGLHSARPEEVNSLCLPVRRKRKISCPEKVLHFRGSQGSGAFSKLRNSTFKCTKLACKKTPDLNTFRVWLHNGTLQNGNVTKRYVLQNGACYKTVRVTKRYALQNGKCHKTVTLQNDNVTKR